MALGFSDDGVSSSYKEVEVDCGSAIWLGCPEYLLWFVGQRSVHNEVVALKERQSSDCVIAMQIVCERVAGKWVAS